MSGDWLYSWFICWIMFLCFIFWRGKPFHFVEGKIFSFYFWWMMYFLIKTKHIWRCLNIFDDDDDNDDVMVMGLRDTFIWNLALLRQTRQRHLTCETKQLLASGDIFRAGWTCLQGEETTNHSSWYLTHMDLHLLRMIIESYNFGTWPINSKTYSESKHGSCTSCPLYTHTRLPVYREKPRSLFLWPSWHGTVIIPCSNM
jgi:hypothetical protein